MAAAAATSVTDALQPLKRNSSYNILPPDMSELLVVLLGNNWSERSSVGNLLLGETKFNTEEEPDFVTSRRQIKEKEIVLINTPDLLNPNISEDKLTEHVELCVRLSDPGPHVFLLVLQPEDFTEEHRLRICRVLELFSDQSFDRSLVLISASREESSFENFMKNPSFRDLIRECRYRYLYQKNLERSELLTRLSQIVKENTREDLSGEQSEDAGLTMKPTSEQKKPPLNLVLCGRRGAEKTSAFNAILGQRKFGGPEDSSECVKTQGEVCGRRVSLLELPALYGKPQEAVMEESFRCISLCDPEGVHAFILVLPVGPLTDEDKGELETIQNTFSSKVTDFILILFTVESDPTAPAVVDFIRQNRDIQEFCQSCGGRYIIFNMKDKQQIPELLDQVDKMTDGGSRCFTKDMFTEAQMKKVVELTDDTKELLEIQLERIQKEKEDEMMKKEENLLKKHQEDLKLQQMKHKEQTEQERKLREKQLKEKDEHINKERELRKKEREEDEKRRRKEENQKQEWRRKVEAAENKLRSEREQREKAERKLELTRREMKKERDTWDKEKKEIYERMHQESREVLEEERTRNRKLLEELYQKRKKWMYAFIGLLLLFLLCYVFLK